MKVRNIFFLKYVIVIFSLFLVIELKAERISKNEYQEEFFSFVKTLYKWAAFAKSKQLDGEELTEIYFRIKKEQVQKFGQFLEGSRVAMHGIYKYHDLHKYKKKEIIPTDIYRFISRNFAIKDTKVEINPNVFILKLIGGDFHFKVNKDYKVEGLVEVVDSFSLSQWEPVVHFINSFRDTLTLDSHLSEKLGRTMLPLVEKYYDYLDTVSKIKIFLGVAEDWNQYMFVGDSENDNNKLAVKIFQNSGPVIIKLLQEMQEEVVGDTPVTEVLRSLNDSKPMDFKKVKLTTQEEILKLTSKKKLKKFKFRSEPLGIASIAQTHMFSLDEKKYVVKVQRQKIEEIFEREKKSINRLVSAEEIFDRGIKRKIRNANEGIAEELNFNNERSNIDLAADLYADDKLGIKTVSVPKKIFTKKMVVASSKVLFMTLADGVTLGKIMERGYVEEVKIAYVSIQNLYKKFLSVALDGRYKNNFYHGDLHRENIFINLKNHQSTLIDFGNAGKITSSMKKHIMNIYENSRKTQTEDEKKLDEAIINLGKSLESLVLEYENKSGGGHPLRTNLVKTFFSKCFNPHVNLSDKVSENRKLQVILNSLEEQKLQLLSTDKDIDKLNIIQEDLDLIKAFRNHCFNGPVNRILSTLADKNMISEKLRIVFDELQKNGLTMPKEIIFFNKSNSLLHGILNNLSGTLEKEEVQYQYVEPDKIFDNMIELISKEGL
jgi:hypothetical protein